MRGKALQKGDRFLDWINRKGRVNLWAASSHWPAKMEMVNGLLCAADLVHKLASMQTRSIHVAPSAAVLGSHHRGAMLSNPWGYGGAGTASQHWSQGSVS